MSSSDAVISVVTPSFNQATFLGAAMASVLGQNYPHLEYVVMDGGSTDHSLDIIRRHADRLHFWASEPDEGPYAAINSGFAHTSGDIMAWLNSDDMYTPWAFAVVAEIFATLPQVEWLTTLYPLQWDRTGRAVGCGQYDGFSRQAFLGGENSAGPGSLGWIQQESTFWRRSLWDRAGGRLDPTVRLAADFDLWARFYRHADLWGVATPLAGFRLHGDQRSVLSEEEYYREARQILSQQGGHPYGQAEAFLRWRVRRALPGSVRRFMGAMRLLPPRRVCRYATSVGGWIAGTEW